MYEDILHLRDRVIAGHKITLDEALGLLHADRESLYQAAADITAALCTREFDSCSIINARSGRCSENCKWCAQSAHYDTGCDTYDVVDHDTCIKAAQLNADKGVKRFSLVASGRAVRGRAIDEMCTIIDDIRRRVPISICASMGLLGREELQKLWDAGVRRYHCNLESAPSHFTTLCTTHTIDDKIATIAIARSIGMDICSGGIIGMGESAEQRVEFAFTLRDIDPVSIPLNILNPIKGTPLEHAEPLTEDDILTTIAIFRFVHPTKQIRFAGGRAKLSPEGQLRALNIGINGAIVGDMLTTIGSRVDDDRQLVSRAGYKF